LGQADSEAAVRATQPNVSNWPTIASCDRGKPATAGQIRMCIAFNRYKKFPQRPLPRSKVQSTHLTNVGLRKESSHSVTKFLMREKSISYLVVKS
jgi:hypothetical protein